MMLFVMRIEIFFAMNKASLEHRAKLVFSLRQKGIRDPKLLKAIEAVDRSDYIEGIFQNRAWEDIPLTIPCGQSVSAPSMVAKMTDSLELNEKCKVLEIGTGSGYQSAVLAQLAKRVYTVERHRRLAKLAEERFIANKIKNVTVFYADGALGLPHQAPFDRILLTAAAEDPPPTLLAQLKTDGIMVLPVGQSDTIQTLIRVRKTNKGLEYDDLGEVRFVPLLEGRA